MTNTQETEHTFIITANVWGAEFRGIDILFRNDPLSGRIEISQFNGKKACHANIGFGYMTTAAEIERVCAFFEKAREIMASPLPLSAFVTKDE